MKSRQCPACRIRLREQTVDASAGTALSIDQCPGCGGIWFDRGELYRVGKPFVEQLEGTPPSPEAELAGRPAARCPACSKHLTRLKDSRYAQTLHAWYCPGCGGMWMSEEDLGEFYRFRAAKLAALRAREQDAMQAKPVKRSDPLLFRSTVEKEMEKDLFDKVVKPAALLAMPVWAIVGATLVERLLPFLKERFSRFKRK